MHKSGTAVCHAVQGHVVHVASFQEVILEALHAKPVPLSQQARLHDHPLAEASKHWGAASANEGRQRLVASPANLYITAGGQRQELDQLVYGRLFLQPRSELSQQLSDGVPRFGYANLCCSTSETGEQPQVGEASGIPN